MNKLILLLLLLLLVLLLLLLLLLLTVLFSVSDSGYARSPKGLQNRNLMQELLRVIMSFLSPNQQSQSTGGKIYCISLTSELQYSFPPVLWLCWLIGRTQWRWPVKTLASGSCFGNLWGPSITWSHFQEIGRCHIISIDMKGSIPCHQFYAVFPTHWRHLVSDFHSIHICCVLATEMMNFSEKNK